MFLYLLSVFAVCSCLIIVILLKYTSVKHLSRNQQDGTLVGSTEFLKLIKKAKIFPVGTQKGWTIYSCQNSSRIWIQKVLLEKDNTTILLFATVTKVPASSQVVYQLLCDVSRRCEWKPGTESARGMNPDRGVAGGKKGGSWLETVVGQDTITEAIYDKASTHLLQTIGKQYHRYWFREENGCSWLAESEAGKSDNTFYLVQPVEDVDQSLLTIVSHVAYPASIEDNIQKLSSQSFSVLDLFTQRKLKATPLLDIKMPSKHVHHYYRDPEIENISSSEDEAEKDVFSQKFSHMNPQEQNAILQKSESILKLSKPHFRGAITDGNSHDLSGSDRSRPRSRTHTQTSYTCTPNGSVLPEKGSSTDHVKDEGQGHPEESSMSKDKLGQAHPPEQNGCVLGVTKLVSKPREVVYTSFTDSDLSDFSGQENKEIDEMIQSSKAKCQLSEDTVKYTTLANQVAAELLALVVRVSNLNVHASVQQQQETTGGWMFCGLENDVVILKRHYHNINLCGSYIGKGIVQAPPQAVMDVIKNPRTRFTYDESLKEVQVLEEISEKIKIVYYRHEVLHMFKKIGYDFTIIQSERSDGEKLVLSMETVDKGVPVPAGVNRVKMMTSGWIIEPVNKDSRLYSMVTYVMQMNFGLCSQNAADKSLIEEMVSKQPLSIAHLRQYLRPTIAISRQISTGSPSRVKKD